MKLLGKAFFALDYSMTCKAQWMSGNAVSRPRGSGGRRDDLDGLFVRSSWEANYARYLNWLVKLGEIKGWEYEADTFAFDKIKRGTRFWLGCAVPSLAS